jgi:sarcosine oxidase delta subunit
MKQLWLARVGLSYEGAYWNGVFDDKEKALKYAKACREDSRYTWKRKNKDSYGGEYWEYWLKKEHCDAWLRITPITLNEMTNL